MLCTLPPTIVLCPTTITASAVSKNSLQRRNCRDASAAAAAHSFANKRAGEKGIRKKAKPERAREREPNYTWARSVSLPLYKERAIITRTLGHTALSAFFALALSLSFSLFYLPSASTTTCLIPERFHAHVIYVFRRAVVAAATICFCSCIMQAQRLRRNDGAMRITSKPMRRMHNPPDMLAKSKPSRRSDFFLGRRQRLFGEREAIRCSTVREFDSRA